MNLLDHVYNFLVVGPSGTGKTMFMAAYAEKHHKRHGSKGYWLTFSSLMEHLKKLLPDWIIPTTDLLDPRFMDADMNPTRKFVFADELNRILSKYDHAKHDARAFVDGIAIHRHKNFDFLASDQVFDFLKGFRTRSHWIVFSGINETVYYPLKDNLSPKLMQWVDQNLDELIALGEENRVNIGKKGVATYAITNGSKTFLIELKRPKWYTLEISEIWKFVSATDLRREADSEELIDYDFEGDPHKLLMLSYHLFKILFTGKLTKEKLSATYLKASIAMLGEAKQIADGGRGGPEKIAATHDLKCYWCDHDDEYQEILGKILDITSNSSDEKTQETLALEERVAAKLGA